MSKRKNKPTVTEALKTAILESGVTQYRIAKETGVGAVPLMKFMRGDTALRMAAVDALAAYLGLQLVSDPDATPPEPTPEGLARPMLAKTRIRGKAKGKA